MKEFEKDEKAPDSLTRNVKNEEKGSESISDGGKKLVSLIVKIIVNATLKECYEEGDKISEV